LLIVVSPTVATAASAATTRYRHCQPPSDKTVLKVAVIVVVIAIVVSSPLTKPS
jgi:hypothetical protein